MINDCNGKRLYLTSSERQAFLKAAIKRPGTIRSFCETLHFTGCRISEALNLTVDRIDLENETIIFENFEETTLRRVSSRASPFTASEYT